MPSIELLISFARLKPASLSEDADLFIVGACSM
jgi:hypothetical protein